MAAGTIQGANAIVLESATANREYGAQLRVLRDKYNSLGDSQKMRCVIRDGNAIYNQVNVSGAFTRYVQGKSTTGLQWYGGLFDMSDLSYYTVENGAVVNKSTTVNSNSLKLCLI